MHKLTIPREGVYRSAKCGDMVYVGFFDIGINSAVTTRRMHLRAAPEKRGAWVDPEIGKCVLENVKSVLLRCLTHVRDLDVQRTCRVRLADSVSASYDVSIWIGPHQKRLEYLNRHLTGNRSTPVVPSSSPWDTWQNRSSGSDGRRDWWQSQQWQFDDLDAEARSVRSRSVYWS